MLKRQLVAKNSLSITVRHTKSTTVLFLYFPIYKHARFLFNVLSSF
jgi:hypothetical protein